MTTASRRRMPRISAAALGVALLGAIPAPASAADLGPLSRPHVRHVRVLHSDWSWRDRCAYAGYYCLYAEYGYVYAYPFDDRPIAHSRYRRVHR